MKLTFANTIAVLAFPLAGTALTVPVEPRAPHNATALETRSPLDCTLHARWTENWSESGWRRYRVKGWADQGKFGLSSYNMLQQWCYWFLRHVKDSALAPKPGYNNPQCNIVGQNEAYADVSSFEGSHGHDLYVELNQLTVNSWRDWAQYNCDVDSSF